MFPLASTLGGLALGATLLVSIPAIEASPTWYAPQATGDAPFSVDSTTLASSITCPRGIQGAAGGVVLLVHGTGLTGNESWAKGPYNLYLPYASPGFDVCWIDLPQMALGDAQVSAEYIAYNIPVLAAQSKTGKVAAIAHSQGAGLNVQWALDFWPSTRAYVSDYIALAPDFHGTIEGPFSCVSEDLLAGGCHYSVLQQTVGSKYLNAQNMRGGSALVATSSLFTRYDDVIQNELGPNATSILPGASNIALQDTDICGPTHLVDHFFMLIDPAAYALAYDALTHDGPASPARFDNKYCNSFANGTLFGEALAQTIEDVALGSVRLFTPIDSVGPRSLVEPPLKAYVCEQGQATVCGST
ncbi:alpha/beta-hydrolase [Clavulina sp. PMI_390]|nr:alpha/beta-hydrolase [Clavulina sp. PMI_390]